MEFYLDKFYNYQAGGQNWNVDFSRLPVSVQKEALAAVQTPGTPDSLVVLAGLQTEFPSAFSKVPSTSTLPAPDLTHGITAFPLNASVDMLLAFIFQKVMDMSMEAAESGAKNTVNLNVAQANMGDKKYAEQMEAAWKNMAGSVVTGAVSMAAGATSFGTGVKGSFDSDTHNGMLKDVYAAKRNTDDYKNTMEHNVKTLQDRAQLNRETASDLDKYDKEVDSPKGLSDDSRKRLEDDIKKKEEQLAECRVERDNYDGAILDAEAKLKDDKLSAADKEQVQAELDGLRARRDQFRADMDGQEVRLDADIEALQSVRSADDNMKLIKAKMDRLKELEQLGVRTPAQDKEMQQLGTDLKKHTQQVKDDHVHIRARIHKLESEATELDKNASDLQTSVRKELASRQEIHAQHEQDVMQLIQGVNNETMLVSSSMQAISGSGQGIGGIPQMFGAQDTAEGDLYQALMQYLGTSGDLSKDYAQKFLDTADNARNTQKDMAQQELDVSRAISDAIR